MATLNDLTFSNLVIPSDAKVGDLICIVSGFSAPITAPTLGTPTLSGSLTQGTAASNVSLSGLSDGSAVTFNIAGLSTGTSGTSRTISGTPASAGALTVVETLSGATGSPKTTTIGSVAAAAPTLATPTLTGTLTQGSAAAGVTISGLTDGSSVAFNIAGLSVGTSGTTRTVSGTPTSSGSLTLTETLAGATGSPKTTTIGTVGAPSTGTNTYSVASAVTQLATGGFRFTMLRGGSTTGASTGRWTISPSTLAGRIGTVAQDFSGKPLTGTVAFAAGETAKTFDVVPATNAFPE